METLVRPMIRPCLVDPLPPGLYVFLDDSAWKGTREGYTHAIRILDGEQCRSDAGIKGAMAEYLRKSQRLYIHSSSSQN